MRALLSLALLLLAAGAALLFFSLRRPGVPSGLAGTLVFVSDRTGMDSLYMRRLPDGVDVRLTFLDEPVAAPALSPDGTHAAFSVGGRIALVALATRDVRFLSLGVDGRDAWPSWHPDGRSLVIASRRAQGESADLYVLSVDAGAEQSPRRRLTETPADESEPAFSPDGNWLVLVREDKLFRLDLADGRVRRLTGGFRKTRQPRFLPSGRLLYLWSEGKRFGIDALDPEGRAPATLYEGSSYYRTLNPAPDGRYLVATFTFDLGFHPLEALWRRDHEELRVLDARARPAGVLSQAWRHSDHSAVWGR